MRSQYAVGLALMAAIASPASVPSVFEGTWIGAIHAGAGYSDPDRDASLQCVDGGADVLIPSMLLSMQGSSINVSASSQVLF